MPPSIDCLNETLLDNFNKQFRHHEDPEIITMIQRVLYQKKKDLDRNHVLQQNETIDGRDTKYFSLVYFPLSSVPWRILV